jgi:hypothetical protein
MKSSLHQAYSDGVVSVCTIHHSLHELAADSGVLLVGVDGDRAYALYDSLLGEDVAAKDTAIAFCDDGIEARHGEHHRKQPGCGLWARKIAGKSMSSINCCEGFVADRAARCTVFWLGSSNDYVRLQ